MKKTFARLYDGFWSFVFRRAIKPAIRSVIKEQFETGLPRIFDKIDELAPELIIQGKPENIEQLIISSTFDIIGRSPTVSEVETIVQQYSPLIAAAKRLIK